MTYGFALVLAARVREGVADLARSTAVFRSIRDTTTKLSQELSQRVASAVLELKFSLDRGDEAVRRTTQATSALLAESRRTLPAEPAQVETKLEAHMAVLRGRLAKWTFRLALLGSSATLLRTLAAPTNNPPIATIPLMGFLVAVIAFLTLLHELRPQLLRPLSIVFHAVTVCLMAYFTRVWLVWRPGLPPTIDFWNILPLLATAIVGLPLGLLEVALGAAVTLVWAWPYTALSWAVPINNALWSGLVCWLVWRMPGDLIALLFAQRLAAAGEIRRRRRLVATLFHDLAGPLQVVQFTNALTAEGRGEPDDHQRVDEMVGRMLSILKSATGEASEMSAVKAGRLFDAMEALFRERLRTKGLVLSTRGPRETRVLCREALLTESVLGNLLSNAVKFSPSGASIDLRVEEERDSVTLVVEDQGPGLPADVREALSSGVMAVSRVGTAGENGNGYGLMLAQDYVREMGGTLEIEERSGGGLSARIRLRAG